MSSLRHQHYRGHRRGRAAWRAVSSCAAAALFCLALGAAHLRAQGQAAAADPASALADALVAACRQDAPAFASHLTATNSAAFLGLPSEQRIGILRRFMLLDDPGKPLLSTDDHGNAVVRCDAGGVLSEIRFGATETRDNLAFIPVQVPEAADEAKVGRFGLVREGGQWKLLSLGLLLLDIPALAQQWQQADVQSRQLLAESQAVQSLRQIAASLEKYRQAFGHLPDDLSQLGPPPPDGASPEKAGLLDAALASGQDQGYAFRYNVQAPAGDVPESDRDRAAGFQLAATPQPYGKDGRRSFYLDSSGALHGDDKHGAVATSTDPRISDPQLPTLQP